MKKCVLGISSFGHDTSACIVDSSSSNVIFASAQERYSNIKFDSHIPFYTINECLKIAEKYNYNISEAVIASDHKLFMGNYFVKELNKIIENNESAVNLINFLKNQAINYGYFNYIFGSNKVLINYLTTLMKLRKTVKMKNV